MCANPSFHALLYISLWKTKIFISQPPLQLGFCRRPQLLWTDACSRLEMWKWATQGVGGMGQLAGRKPRGLLLSKSQASVCGPEHQMQWDFHGNSLRLGNVIAPAIFSGWRDIQLGLLLVLESQSEHPGINLSAQTRKSGFCHVKQVLWLTNSDSEIISIDFLFWRNREKHKKNN